MYAGYKSSLLLHIFETPSELQRSLLVFPRFRQPVHLREIAAVLQLAPVLCQLSRKDVTALAKSLGPSMEYILGVW
jgi:hypothetical protein